MKVSVFKQKGNKETIVRQEIDSLAQSISGGEYVDEVHHLREYYHLIHPRRTEDGKMVTDFKFKMDLPRVCFAAEVDNYKQKQRILAYNGLMVLEANNLADYDEAVQIRNAAARLPQTMMAFLGASGRSVKIVCRGERLPDNGGGLPTEQEKMAQWQESQRQQYLMPGRTVKRTYGLNYQFGLKPEHKLKGNCYLLVKK